MELIPIECGNCKAKLKIKAMPSRMPKEVKCPKCGKAIPVAPQASPAPATTPAPAPAAAPIPVSPKTPPLPPSPPPPKPAVPANDTAQLTAPPRPVGATSSASGIKKPAAPIVISQVTETPGDITISAKCPACQWQTKVSPSLIGKKIRCKQCSGIILISAPDATESPAAAAPVPSPAPETTPPPPMTPPPLTPPEPVHPAPQSPAPSPAPPPTTHGSTPEVTAGPALSGVNPATPGATTHLIAEITDLKSRLENARHETSGSLHRLADAERRAQIAETRVREAEKALHDLAGKNAVDNMAATRKITDLEHQLAEQTHLLSGIAAEVTSDLDQVSGRVNSLREKIGRLGR